MPDSTYSPGLAGVIGGVTAICTTGDGLSYRGYPIEDLAEHCTYEEVVYLLLKGELPTPQERSNLSATLRTRRGVPDAFWRMVRLIPRDQPMMDVLRTGVSFLGHFLKGDALDTSIDLVAKLPTIVAGAWRIQSGAGDPIAPDPSLSHTANYFHMLNMSPADRAVKIFDTTLILYAEHEFNASAFAARVTVSTQSDLVSGVVSAIGTLKGPLHGGANEEAIKLLKSIGSPERAEAYVLDLLAHKQLVMGFGHRIYRSGDHRALLLKQFVSELSAMKQDYRWEQIAQTVEDVMLREKHLYPNVDFPCGAAYDLLGLPTALFTPIFVSARTVGWCAHIMEQLANNRIIRPASLYNGPALRHVGAP
jgi:citrate synthase